MIIHDADTPISIQPFINLETELGVKSTFYPRPLLLNQEYLDAQIQGWEVGIQYDTYNNTEFMEQLQAFRNCKTTNEHAQYDSLYNATLWSELGLVDVMHLPYSSYLTDTNSQLKGSIQGDLAIIQLHVDWSR